MEVIYSIDARLGGGGIGNTAWYAVQGPERAGCLKRVICSSNKQAIVPPERIRALGGLGRVLKRLGFADKSGRLDDWFTELFDYWSARVLEPCHMLHTWSDLGHTLARGKALGSVTMVEHMVHPAVLVQTLREHSTHWQIRPYDLPSPHRYQRYLSELAIADYIALPSEYDVQTHLAQGVPAHKLKLIPYGVDLKRFWPAPEPPPEHPFRVIFVGNVSLRKGAPYLLEAWRQLGWRDAELWIVGNVNPDIQWLLPRWAQVPGIRFWGHVQSMLDLYHQAHVFVLPSLGEGSALVTYEAMASGLPVIVTPNTGSLARPEVDGLIVPPGDSATLAAALEKLRAGPQMRAEMGRQARLRIEPFTWEAYGNRLVETYQQLSRASPASRQS